MTGFASPHFETVDLSDARNARRDDLPSALHTPELFAGRYGTQTIRGMAFDFGEPGGSEVALLDREPIAVELGGRAATYVLVVHVVEDVVTNYLDGFADRPDLTGFDQLDGYELGGLVSEYELELEDGSIASAPIRRRLAIQQARYQWGSVPATCVAAAEDAVFPSLGEALAIGPEFEHPLEMRYYGHEWRCLAATMLHSREVASDGVLWIHALENPVPTVPLRRLVCRPRDERSAIYAVSVTELEDHPLRPGPRRALRLPLPAEVGFDEVGEVRDLEIDLGTVISARAALDYDQERWEGPEPLVEPVRSAHELVVEYAAHPGARLRLGDAIHDLAELEGGESATEPGRRPVRLKFLDAEGGEPVAVRLHLHDESGGYLSPRGHHRRVENAWIEHVHPEFVNVENQYAYVDGECVVDLPLGTVFIEVTRGYEVAPLRTAFEVDAATDEREFRLERALRWRDRGWVTADTHAHFLSPQTALLLGRAEGINVVNLLASQWGETFSNVGDFDGRTTLAADPTGAEECLVRVGSENRMHVLGHISLLGYGGELIQPLCTGGPDESFFGDPVEVTMAEWAQRCIDQGGLVVMPHAPMPQLERAADIVLGLVGAIELMSLNPLHPDIGQLGAYGIADWYHYLNLGYHIPLVGGSDKMSTAMLLGGIRTYSQIGERQLTYEAWKESVERGDTFVTVGPLASLTVGGISPGGTVELDSGGGTVAVEWEVESVRLPVDRVEVVAGGAVVAETDCAGALSAGGRAEVSVSEPTWIALRVRGSYHGRRDDVAAHTSAVRVLVGGAEPFSEVEAAAVLDQVDAALAYVRTLAPRPEAQRHRQLCESLEAARAELERRIGAARSML